MHCARSARCSICSIEICVGGMTFVHFVWQLGTRSICQSCVNACEGPINRHQTNRQKLVGANLSCFLGFPDWGDGSSWTPASMHEQNKLQPLTSVSPRQLMFCKIVVPALFHSDLNYIENTLRIFDSIAVIRILFRLGLP